MCGLASADVDLDNDATMDCNDGSPNDADKVEPGCCDCGTPVVATDYYSTVDFNHGRLYDA